MPHSCSESTDTEFETRLESLRPDSSDSLSFYESDCSVEMSPSRSHRPCSKIKRDHVKINPQPFRADHLIDSYCQKNSETTICQLYQALKDGQLMDFLATQLDDPIRNLIQMLTNLVNADLNAEQIIAAIETFLENLSLPTINIPIKGTFDRINQTVGGIFQRNYGYSILPGLVLFLVLVWALVIYGTIHWTLGLILTIICILVYYFNSIIYAQDLPNFVNRQAQEITEPFQRTMASLAGVGVQIPNALIEALRTLTDNQEN